LRHTRQSAAGAVGCRISRIALVAPAGHWLSHARERRTGATGADRPCGVVPDVLLDRAGGAGHMNIAGLAVHDEWSVSSEHCVGLCRAVVDDPASLEAFNARDDRRPSVMWMLAEIGNSLLHEFSCAPFVDQDTQYPWRLPLQADAGARRRCARRLLLAQSTSRVSPLRRVASLIGRTEPASASFSPTGYRITRAGAPGLSSRSRRRPE